MDQSPAPRKSWPRRHKILTGLGIVVLVIIVASVASAGGSHPKHVTTAAAQPSSAPGTSYTPPPAPAATPAPAPSPDGTYQGSCDYTLASGIYGNDHLVGEVDLHNTGNIGTIVRVRITWPQEGMAPVAAHKTVRTKPAARKAVRFDVPTPTQGNVVTLLQSWQERHGLRDGCTYRAAMVNTFGQVQP